MNHPYEDTLMQRNREETRSAYPESPYAYTASSHAIPKVTLSQPCMEGFYSKNLLGTFHSDLRCLRYYYKDVSFPMNLKIGFETLKVKDEEKTKQEKLNDILKWIKAKEQLNNKTFNFVCFRGLLTTLMVTPYENREGWKISAVKYKDTIYLWQEDTEEKKKRLQNLTLKDKEMCYYGRKFEQYTSTGDVDMLPTTDHPVDENEEFCCVMSSKIGNFRLLYGAEVDCITANKKVTAAVLEKEKTLKDFVELKTSQVIKNIKQERNFKRFKLLKWWAQSFLVGIPKIICGWRNHDGIVSSVEEFATSAIPGKGKDLWSGNACINFLHDILHFIKAELDNLGDLEGGTIEWSPRRPVMFKKLPRDTKSSVLPHWFIE
ncbi:decapping and exoribonuclease protein-like [Artemia franciscana]|uniref:Decapping nuclease n=1 Tax=Artemia franciscana TaxID=6661 RepID=A0AA88HVA0_ARTSF|nr:hypothetical protein QYM36_008961 [Artemia franciscana]